MKERLHYIDNLKGFLILLVVLGHCIQNTDPDFDHNIVFRYIYSFHMPLFMCVSGFVSYRTHTAWQTVRKRFMQLIVPFMAWVLVSCCRRLDFTVFPEKILHPDTALWFLWVLFFIILLLKVCEVLSERAKLRIEYVAGSVAILMIGIMVVLKFKLFGFQFLAWYFPFYCMGYFMRKYLSLFEKLERRVMWPLFVLFVVLAFWWMRKDPPSFMSENSSAIYNYGYKFVTAIVALMSFFPLFKYYVNHNMLIISKMGGVTLGIYAVHQMFVSIFVDLSNELLELFPYSIYVLLLWFAVTAVSCLAYALLAKNRYTSLLFLGKSK